MGTILSIVIPVYNVQSYIKDCLKNIINLYEDSVEILLIDDGSTDDSRRIIDEYTLNYKNIKAFHKKNGGLSDARNYGLMHAKGKYVFFMDSDDFVTDTFLNDIVEFISKNDVDAVLWDADIYGEDGKILAVDSSYYHHSGVDTYRICSGSEIIELQLENHNDYVTTVWSGLYDRQFLIDNNFWFEKGLLHEDEIWSQKVLLACKRIKYFNSAYYCYRRRKSSIMNPISKDYSRSIVSLIYSFSYLPLYYDLKIKDKELKKKLKGNNAKRYLHMIVKFQLSEYPELAKRINKKQIFYDSNGCKDKIRAFILLINVKAYCLLMKK